MTLPSNFLFPEPPENLENEDLKKYLKELNFSLKRMYEDVATNSNGVQRRSEQVGRENWLPVLKGNTLPGNFTYTLRYGTALRRGILVDAWFHIGWSAIGGATGQLILELPYKVANAPTNIAPFVGVVRPANLTYTSGTGIIIDGLPNTFNGRFFNIGTGGTGGQQGVQVSGNVSGHIRYLGQQYER